MDLNLTGKNALVCGGSKGIGQASAIELSLLGANVTLLARDESSLRSSLEKLDKSKGQQHDLIVADLLDTDQLGKLLGKLTEQKPIHILVNNTGGPPGGPIANAENDEFLRAFRQHLIASHTMTRQVIEGMKQEGYGRVINVLSTSVRQPIPGLGVSNTIRAAMGNWSKTLSQELAPFGITVNNVLPGATATGRLSTLIEKKAAKKGISVVEEEEVWRSGIPAGRFAEPSEVGAAVAFLASPAASYINGINIPVDGGRTKCY